MNLEIVIFILISIIIISYDLAKRIVPDRIIIPSTIILWSVALFFEKSLLELGMLTLVATIIFVGLLATPFAFGGGDLRYLLFCIPLLDIKSFAWFFLLAGALQAALLLFLQKRRYAFVPTMFAATLLAHFYADSLWQFVGVET